MSIEEVAAEAGVSRPTIYLRFPGKAELATAALASYREGGGLPRPVIHTLASSPA